MTVTAAILLAADDTKLEGVPVALLPWRYDETLIEFQIAQLKAAQIDVIEVVVGAFANELIPVVSQNDVEPIVDTLWEDGEESWLRVGAAAVPRNTAAAIITHVRQLRPASLYAALLEAREDAGAPITRPVLGAVAGWPLAVSREVLAEVRNLSGGGLGALLERHRARTVHVESEMASFEIKELPDVHRARELCGIAEDQATG